MRIKRGCEGMGNIMEKNRYIMKVFVKCCKFYENIKKKKI